MLPRYPRPTRYRCEGCGTGRLLWERRSDGHGSRFLATCSNADCGHIETRIADGPTPDDGLRSFLLGDRPAQPYVPPWVRFFLRSSNCGAEWNSAGEPCPDCAGSLLMAIKLSWTPQRAADPVSALLCIDCGFVACTIWLAGDLTDLHMSGDAWTNLPVPLQALKRAVSDRFPSGIGEDDDDPWNFQ